MLNTFTMDAIWELIHSDKALSHIITSIDNTRVYTESVIQLDDKFYQIEWSAIDNAKSTFNCYCVNKVERMINGEFSYI